MGQLVRRICVYLVRLTVSLLSPHWPYSLPPHEYACPSADTARQCQPPMAAWTIFTPFIDVTRRGFHSVSLRSTSPRELPTSSTKQQCQNVSRCAMQDATRMHLWPWPSVPRAFHPHDSNCSTHC